MMPPDENEEKQLSSHEVDAVVGLLDFYSDRAEAQASFLVACVFGLFTLLAIVQSVKNVTLILLSTIPYSTLALIGFHCLQRFSYYANMAETIRQALARYAEFEKISTWIKKKGKWKRATLKEKEERLSKKYGGILRKFMESPMRILGAILIFVLPSVIVYVQHILSKLS